MKEIKKEEDNSSAVKDIIQGIVFLVIPVIIIYLIIKFV